MQQAPRRLVWLAALAALAAAPVSAQDPAIFAGLDTWYTPSGGAQISVSIPAGYFCNGASPPLNRNIQLQGAPLNSNPSLGQTDTVVERPADAFFDPNDVTTTGLRLVALSLQSVNAFSVNCGSYTQLWDTRVHLNGPQPLGRITIRRTSPAGGTFDASFSVSANVFFTNVANNRQRGPLVDNQTITTAGACWTHAPGSTSVVVAGPVSIDTNGDGTFDYNTLLGTGPNFWSGSCGPINHTGPHPTTCSGPGPDCPEDPDPNCKEPWIDEQLSAAARKGVGFVFETRSDEQPVGTTDGMASNKAALNLAVSQADLEAKVIDICVQQIGHQYLK